MADVPRNKKGHPLPGYTPNPGGRAGMRIKRLNQIIEVETADFQTVLDEVLAVAHDRSHKSWSFAVEWLGDRYFGPIVRSQKAVEREENPLAELPDEQVADLARAALEKPKETA